LNLEVYVFLGVVTVQLGIACSNYTVQVANLNPPIGRSRLPTAIDGADSTHAPDRQQELSPKNIEIPEH